MIPIAVQHGDIGATDVDLLVNASNTVLRLGSGVSGAIRRACDPAFQDQLDKLLADTSPDGLEPGAVVMTDAPGHPRARLVAHVAVMDYRQVAGAIPRPDLARIETGARNLWTTICALAEPVSVAMVALGAGTGGIGLRDSVNVACRTLKNQLDNEPGALKRVVFVAYDLIEYINTAAVVRQHFAHTDLSTMTDEHRQMMESLDS